MFFLELIQYHKTYYCNTQYFPTPLVDMSYLEYQNNLMFYFLSGVRTGLLPRGMKREVGFLTNVTLKTAKKSKAVNKMFTTTTLSCLSGTTGETKSPKSFQPHAGHPEAVQEESGEFWVFLEILCLKTVDRRRCYTQETGLALKQKSLSWTHISTCRQTKKHRACMYCIHVCTHTYTLTVFVHKKNNGYDWDKLIGDFKMIYLNYLYVVWNCIYVWTFVKSPWLSDVWPNVF